jgi:hypothetical protein
VLFPVRTHEVFSEHVRESVCCVDISQESFPFFHAMLLTVCAVCVFACSALCNLHSAEFPPSKQPFRLSKQTKSARGSLTPSFDLSAAASTVLNAAGGGAGDGDSDDESVPESPALRAAGVTPVARAAGGGAAGRIKTYCLRGSVR